MPSQASLKLPNAAAQPRLEAAAQRRLEGVGCSRVSGDRLLATMLTERVEHRKTAI
jgi:hypothetical protein